MSATRTPIVGRFAPSPTGRMHLGNVYTAVLSWLWARATGGRWVLRIEDLDPQRSRVEYARQIEDDLLWLGLEWDEGGLADAGPAGPYSQSRRSEFYRAALQRLVDAGLVYGCTCRRADIMATQAPHQSDGRIVYAGTCRPAQVPPFAPPAAGARRLYVPDRDICFTDAVFGPQAVNLSTHCGDFVLQRADGAWAYQLAVVVDDALMGINGVMRGADLLLSAAQQIYLYELLGFRVPQFAHLPLVCNAEGVRLSKRDAGVSMAELRATHTPRAVLGLVARLAGMAELGPEPTLSEMTTAFDIGNIAKLPPVITI